MDRDGYLLVCAERGDAPRDAQPVVDARFDPQANPILARMLKNGRGAIVRHARERQEWAPGAGAPRVRSWLGVPLVASGRTIGILSLSHARAAVFTRRHLRRLQTLAPEAAAAIGRAQLFDEVRASRQRLQALSRRLLVLQETDRQTIARELHDEIGRLLTELKLTLETGAREAAPAVDGWLQHAHALTDQLAARVRELSLSLRPPVLDHLGLQHALLWHLERYTAHTGVAVKFEHAGLTERLRPEVEVAAYRIVEEALSNVARHAGVVQAVVRLRKTDRALNLQVLDRGAGFDARAALVSVTTGGLSAIQERAELLGGDLTIASTPGEGTRLTAVLPLEGGAHMERRWHRP